MLAICNQDCKLAKAPDNVLDCLSDFIFFENPYQCGYISQPIKQRSAHCKCQVGKVTLNVTVEQSSMNLIQMAADSGQNLRGLAVHSKE